MPEPLLPGQCSPLPGGERSREARVRGIQTFPDPSPQPSPLWGEGEGCSVRRAFIESARVLRQAGIDTPELDARLLLCHAAGLSHEAYVAKAGDKLQPATLARLITAIDRRLKREPVSRIIGTREFYGRLYDIGPEALDPRPETETLIEAVLALIDRRRWRDQSLKLLDLGTGTGCILITMLAELPRVTGIGTDLSPSALALAAANAMRLGVGSRAAFVAADWLDGIGGKYDLVLSNPPYLASGEIAGLAQEVAAYDPMLALDGGPDGLDAYRRIAARAPAVLAEGGRLLVEIGASQAAQVSGIVRAAGLKLDQDQAIGRDLAGRPRTVTAGL